MKRELEYKTLKAGTYPAKRVAIQREVNGGEEAFQSKRTVLDTNDLYQKLSVAELKTLKFQHKAALAEERSMTLHSQIDKVMLENQILRSELGGSFLLPVATLKDRIIAKEQSASKSQGLAAKTFPWLSFKGYNLPNTVMKRICKCLCDDDLFRFRGISLLFYTAYFEQAVKCTKFPNADAFEFQYKGPEFNALRAVRLARHGRRFPKLEYLDVNRGEISAELTMAISPYNFPSLCVLSLEFRLGSIQCLPGNPNLLALRVSIIQEKESEIVNPVKFPKLRQLRGLNKPDDAVVKIPPHPQIEYMELYCSVDWTGMDIGKAKFPKLKFLESEYIIPMMTKARLSTEGVEVTESV